MPGAGFEPARPKPGDFKSPAFTISPSGRITQSILSPTELPRRSRIIWIVSPIRIVMCSARQQECFAIHVS